MRFSIGEFSLVTSISIKALRLYHEKGLLVPAEVYPDTGYRYYGEADFDRARSIRALKEFDFSLAEIKTLLDECSDEADMLEHLQQKLERVEGKIDRYRNVSSSLKSIIEFEKEAAMEERQQFEIEEKVLDTMLIAGHRMKGKYEEVGKGLGLVCRKMGRQINGKPMTLYHDCEYKEDGADFEPCVPVRKGSSTDQIDVRELAGGKCVSLIHRGPYERLRESYKKVFAYINEKGYKSKLPSREVYKKGPGMIRRTT